MDQVQRRPKSLLFLRHLILHIFHPEQLLFQVLQFEDQNFVSIFIEFQSDMPEGHDSCEDPGDV